MGTQFSLAQLVPDFSADTLSGCPGLTVTFSDSTTPKPDSLFWDFGNGQVSTDTMPIVSFPVAGTYSVKLIVYSGASIDSITKINFIQINGATLDFTIDTTKVCLGDSIHFQSIISSPDGIDSILWNFGNGQSDSIQNPVHLYSNSGVFTISFGVVDTMGCVAISQQDSLVVVANPVSIFSLNADSICLGDSSFFTSTSTGASLNISWDFGDGGIDSVLTPKYEYSSAGSFTTTLAIVDTIGCVDTSTVDILVGAIPTAGFTASTILDCAPADIGFTDQSSGPIANWQWSFGNGVIDSVQNPSVSLSDSGTYAVKLIVIDSLGCSDTTISPNAIRLLHQSIGFDFTIASSCNPLDYTFNDTSQVDTTITYFWKFGDGNISNSGPSVNHVYAFSGAYPVELIITNAVGCKDTLIQNVNPNLVPTSIISVNALTVLNDFSDSLSFTYYSELDFSKYYIYWESSPGTYSLIDSISNALDTSYVHFGINTTLQSHNYKVQLIDSCGQTSNLLSTIPHGTIDLQASASMNQVSLNWSAYSGWNVNQYEVYRVSDYDGTTDSLMATLPGSSLIYNEFNLPGDSTYCYRVKAIDQSGNYFSWSDTACALPSAPVVLVPIHIINATVENNQDVLIKWELPSDPNAVVYLQRTFSINGNFWIYLDSFSTSINSYLDTTVDVSVGSAWYRVFYKDNNDSISPPSRGFRTINLHTVEEKDGSILVGWFLVSGWENTPQAYVIEGKSASDAFWTVLGSRPGGNSFYIDNATQLGKEEYCYRVRAIEDGGNNSFSLSNESCIERELTAPNTITPDGDGSNDFFVVSSLDYYVANKFTVFNRWGNEVYSSVGYANDWDGVNNSGNPLPDGTYYYILEIDDLGKSLTGYVMIHR